MTSPSPYKSTSSQETVLREACDKYGLPHDLKTLLVHIEAHRELTNEFYRGAAEGWQRRLRQLALTADYLLHPPSGTDVEVFRHDLDRDVQKALKDTEQ